MASRHHALLWLIAVNISGHIRLEHLQQPQRSAVCRLQLFHLNSISVEHITRSLCAVSGDAPAPNAVEYGWELHDINIRLITRDMADIDTMLLNTSSSWSGRCMEQQHVCTMFCGCSSSTQANSFDATTITVVQTVMMTHLTMTLTS